MTLDCFINNKIQLHFAHERNQFLAFELTLKASLMYRHRVYSALIPVMHYTCQAIY